MTTLTVTINGRAYGPREVRGELSMNDFLREYLGMTGTKFGCGAAQCLSCAVIVDNPDGTSQTMPTCVVLRRTSMARLSARSKAMQRTVNFLFCKKLSSSISRFSVDIAPPAF